MPYEKLTKSSGFNRTLPPHNPDVDPTRLQPWGNPHARLDGVDVNEPVAVAEDRVAAAEELSDEGISVEDFKADLSKSDKTAMQKERQEAAERGETLDPLEARLAQEHEKQEAKAARRR